MVTTSNLQQPCGDSGGDGPKTRKTGKPLNIQQLHVDMGLTGICTESVSTVLIEVPAEHC